MDSRAREGIHGELRLFVVERLVPGLSEHGLVMLQIALTQATARIAAREHGLRYLWSIVIPGQDRLLSLFTARSIEPVRAASNASLVPFLHIENGYFLPDPTHEAGV